MKKPFIRERVTVFGGGGFGWLKVSKDNDESEGMVKGTQFNLEGGINIRLFWKIGFYGIGKYLYAQKKSNGINVIDFNEFIVLLGFTLNVGI